MRVRAPFCLALEMMVSMGLMVPSAFEMWLMATIFVSLLSRESILVRSHSPESVTGMTSSFAPVLWQSICHGTMFEWCSSADMRIRSPALIFPENVREEAIRLMLSVVPDVNMISWLDVAFRFLAMFSRAASCAAVASLERWWAPRWMLEFVLL